MNDLVQLPKVFTSFLLSLKLQSHFHPHRLTLTHKMSISTLRKGFSFGQPFSHGFNNTATTSTHIHTRKTVPIVIRIHRWCSQARMNFHSHISETSHYGTVPHSHYQITWMSVYPFLATIPTQRLTMKLGMCSFFPGSWRSSPCY